MEQQLKKIKRSSAIGLWGSVAVTIATILHLWLSKFQFYPSPALSKWMLATGCIMAVLIIATILLTLRKKIPAMRQMDDLKKKVTAYSELMSTIYNCTLTVVIIECAFCALSVNNVLLMFVILMVLTLILNFPNMYKMKVDLGLSDDEMTTLYGDKYVK